MLNALRTRYGFDGILVNVPGRPAHWRDYLASEEVTAAGRQLTWRSGLQTRVPPDDNLHAFAAGGRALPRADYSSVDVDDPATYRLAGYVWNTWHAPGLWDIPGDADLADPAAYPEWFTASLRAARALCPEASVHAEVFSPFTHLLELFGYQNALLVLLETPETCCRLLERFTAMVEAQVDRLAEHEPDAILISSAFAGAGFIVAEPLEQVLELTDNLVDPLLRLYSYHSLLVVLSPCRPCLRRSPLRGDRRPALGRGHCGRAVPPALPAPG